MKLTTTGIPGLEAAVTRAVSRVRSPRVETPKDPAPKLTQAEATALGFARGVIEQITAQQRFPGPVEETFREQQRALDGLIKRAVL